MENWALPLEVTASHWGRSWLLWWRRVGKLLGTLVCCVPWGGGSEWPPPPCLPSLVISIQLPNHSPPPYLPPPFFFFLSVPCRESISLKITAEMTEAPEQEHYLKLYLPIAAAIHAPVPEGRGCTPPSEWSIWEKEKKEFWRWSRETVFKRSRKYKGWNLGPWTVGILLLASVLSWAGGSNAYWAFVLLRKQLPTDGYWRP